MHTPAPIGVRQGPETAGTGGGGARRPEMDLVLFGSGGGRNGGSGGLATELGADNVRFLARRSPLDMPELYAAADYQLVTLRDLPELHGHGAEQTPGRARLACAAPVVASAGGDTAGPGRAGSGRVVLPARGLGPLWADRFLGSPPRFRRRQLRGRDGFAGAGRVPAGDVVARRGGPDRTRCWTRRGRPLSQSPPRSHDENSLKGP